MKPVLAIVALLLGALATTACVGFRVPDYRHCEPFCVTFEQIGDRHVAAARDASGRLLAHIETDSRTNGFMVAAKVPPLSASDLGQQAFSGTIDALQTQGLANDGCSDYAAETKTRTWRTTTEIVTSITVLPYCDGKLVDARLATIRVPVRFGSQLAAGV